MEITLQINEEEGKVLDQVYRELIRLALEATDGKFGEAAKWLGVTQRTLYSRRKGYGMKIFETKTKPKEYYEMLRRYPE